MASRNTAVPDSAPTRHEQLAGDVAEQVGLRRDRERHRPRGCVREDDEDVGEGPVGIDGQLIDVGNTRP